MNRWRRLYHRWRNSTLRNNRTLNWILKLGLLLGLGWVLYARLVKEDALTESLALTVSYAQFPNLWYCVAAVAVLPLFWALESYRWQVLVKRVVPHESATFGRSLRAILSGQAIGSVVNNYIGKVGGRLLVYRDESRAELVFINYFDAEAVKLMYDVLGAAGGLYVLADFLEWKAATIWGVAVLVALILLGRGWLFFNARGFVWLAQRMRLSAHWQQRLAVMERYSSRELMIVLGLAGARVLLNFGQYYLLLRFFHVDIDLATAFVLVSAVYFIVSNIPLPTLAGVLARIQIALFIWSPYTDNVVSLSAIPVILWLVNNLLSSLVGTYFLMRMNIARQIAGAEK